MRRRRERKPIPPDVWEYFCQRYEKSNIRVVPGHWPDFQTKEEVDKWFKFLQNAMEYAFSE